ncbi:MAG: hypothetical protein U0795_24020 [Pirellulales bacterium]
MRLAVCRLTYRTLLMGSLLAGWLAVGCRPAAEGPASVAPEVQSHVSRSWSEAVAMVRRGESDLLECDAAELPADAADELRQLTGLKRVRLAASRVGERELEALAGLNGLIELRLDRAPIDDSGAAIVSRMSALQRVNLAAGQFSDAGLASLAELPRLELLRFHSPRITDAGMKPLSGAKSLRFLHLIDVPISDAGLVPLEGLPGLESLYVDGGGVTEDGLGRLIKALPQLHLHWNQQHVPGDPQSHEHAQPVY